MITVVSGHKFKKTSNYFERIKEVVHMGWVDKYGRKGVEALKVTTPKDTGKTADSWYYEIERKGADVSIVWKNSNINDGVPIAVIIQYGHGTANGTYVEGVDYINPALGPIFNDIAKEIWEEVSRK